MPQPTVALVGDIGGSNARLAIARLNGGQILLDRLQRGPTPCGALAAHIEAFWLAAGRPALTAIALGAAGRVRHTAGHARVVLTNKSLLIDSQEVAAACGLSTSMLMGDLAACAHALPILADRDLVALDAATANDRAARLVIGVGTGFGAAVLTPQAVVLETEAGHADLAAVSAVECRLKQRLAAARRLSVESVLSGEGLRRLATALSGQEYESCEALFEQLRQRSPAAQSAIAVFSTWLGRTASNLVLSTGAWGGVYLVGGVIQGLDRWLDVAAYRAGFIEKAPFGADLAAVPTFRITETEPALKGLARVALGAPPQTP